MVEAIKGAAPASWRTTAAGGLTILVALGVAALALLDGDPKTEVNVPVLLAALTTGWGLISARDDKVTSAQAGAEPSK